MCVHCSFPIHLKIRIEPTSTLLLCRKGERLPSFAVNQSHGTFDGHIDGDWMFIEHPTEGVGLVGLPMSGSRSWQSAWDNMLVELSYQKGKRWITLQNWNELPLIHVHS